MGIGERRDKRRLALEVVAELARLGAREVVLIGGEAYLHAGFLDIIAALAEAGITPVMTTGGRAVDGELARAMADAGFVILGGSTCISYCRQRA